VRGCFVTASDTGAGKTVVAAAIAAALRARGERVAVRKPVLTGTDEPPDHDWPPDDELLAMAAGAEDRAAVAPVRFGPPVSPHLAAALAAARIEPRELVGCVRVAAADADAVVVEGIGGALVPLDDGYTVRDLAADLGLPVVVAARPGLGTINHSLLTLEALRSAGLKVAGVVLTPWPPQPSVVERSNRRTIGRLGGVDVATLPRLDRPRRRLLAAAGARLPLERWLGVADYRPPSALADASRAPK
jgi:dethiobiotin synthetase